jgi:hypothetical protein
MSPYKVMVDDNFHYMDEDERSEYVRDRQVASPKR